jgi:hypothetical protein
MIMNILTLFVCINIGMGILSVPGTPFWVNGTENCFFPSSGAPGPDPTLGNVPDILIGSNVTSANITSTLEELRQPTNSTATDPSFGDTGILNNFFDTVDQAAKSMEVMRHVISGGYIMDTIGHFAVSCSFNSTGHLVMGAEHEVWTNLKGGIQTLIFLLGVFTLFYWATGRGHILTS